MAKQLVRQVLVKSLASYFERRHRRERMRALQARKQDLADANLGENAGKTRGNLTVTDIAGLFGLHTRGRRFTK
ncbi:BQ5605_C002g01650 [Microbotryum silenes-dioicae]|uniref:BQ5605_C002g01650 protein n=1 Tax=Microbotryum silenes-dioicae TaxID=796604 RepID=A0A2X0M3R3_9BASI|nr:BQ5605_C002g01650 [Microbotryum silenes-dioicae]